MRTATSIQLLRYGDMGLTPRRRWLSCPSHLVREKYRETDPSGGRSEGFPRQGSEFRDTEDGSESLSLSLLSVSLARGFCWRSGIET